MARGRKAKPKSVLCCVVCDEIINENNGNYLVCPHCRSDKKAVHIPCANLSKLITANGFYYCPNHIEHALVLSPSRQSKSNEQDERAIASSTQNEQNKSHSSPSLSNSVISISDSNKNGSKINEQNESTKNDTQEEERPLKQGIEPAPIPPQQTLIQPTRISYASKIPNFSGSKLLPPPLDPKCDLCDFPVTAIPYFQCKVCKIYLHDQCPLKKERMNQIEGSWTCTSCLLEWAQFISLQSYRGNDPCVIQERNGQQAMRYANMRLNDPYFSEPRISMIPQIPKETENRLNMNYLEKSNKNRHITIIENEKASPAPCEKVSSEKTPEGISANIPSQPNNPSLSDTNQVSEILKMFAEQQKEFMSQMVDRIEKKFEEYDKGKSHQNSHPNSAPKSYRSQISADSSSDDELTKQVEASIRRSRALQENERIKAVTSTAPVSENAQMKGINEKLFELQMNESKKNSYRLLPKVKNADYEWKIFYESFMSTKDIFSPQENVVRLQQAIESEEIKRIGGHNLFNISTYELTLKEIDNRIAKPGKLLLKEKYKLINQEKLANGDKKGIVNFISEIKKYSHLVDKVGSYADKSDVAIISRLSRILPDRLIAGWSSEFNNLKKETPDVLISDMATWLDKQTESIETQVLFDEIDPYGELKGNSNKKKFEGNRERYNNRNNKKEVLFSHVENKGTRSKEIASKESKDSPANYCWFHGKSGHSSLYCYTLLGKSGPEVCKLAKEKGICTMCSRKAHANCPYKNKMTCFLPDCKLNHALIFCYKRKVQESNSHKQNRSDSISQCSHININTPSSSQDPPSIASYMYEALTHVEVSQDTATPKNENKFTSMNQHGFSNASISVICVTLFNNGKSLKCALLLDSGSNASLIDAKYADLLNMDGPMKPINIAWSGNKTRSDETSKIVKAQALGFHNGAKSYEICFRTIKNLEMPVQKLNAEELKLQFPHLRKVALTSYTQIIGIIGTDQPWFFRQLSWIASKSRKDTNESPIAFLTPLGYSLIGTSFPLKNMREHLIKNNNHVTLFSHSLKPLNEEEEYELIEMQRRAMGLEYLRPYENDRVLADEEQALNILKEGVRKIPGSDKYEAPLLWRDPNCTLPTFESYKIAIKRLHILINHTKRIGKFDEISAEIENLKEKKYARLLTQNEIENPPKKAFYLPIFISSQKGKRVRLIWDAAARVNGKSLNDYLLPGPNLYTDLLSLLMRARQGTYIIKADIREMFHQVKIKSEDCAALRFLFVNPKTGRIDHYEMTVMIFGAICSPTTSQFVKNEIAKEEAHNHPSASDIIQNNTYVDDLVVSINEKEKGKRLIFEARKILLKGGFELVKLKGNHPELLDLIKNELSEKEKKDPKLLIEDEEEKLLGYMINYTEDTLSLATFEDKLDPTLISCVKRPTKKDILRYFMSQYDPIGFFSFHTSKSKLLYHWICKKKGDWNEELDEELMPYWEKILNWTKSIMKIKIPRAYTQKINEACIRQLLIFGDAGKEMLCTVAYIRLLDKNRNQLGFNFIGSKSYTVPINQKRSIPELELDVAAKATDFSLLIKRSHSIKFDETLYGTDSTCVHSWIVGSPQKLTVYMSNRIKKIKEISDPKDWFWIPTELQPADYSTKFESMPQLIYENEWFVPKISFLREEIWMIKDPPYVSMFSFIHKIFDEKTTHAGFWDMYSSYNRLLDVTKWIVKFYKNIRILALEKKLLDTAEAHKKAIQNEIERLKVMAHRQHVELMIIRSVQANAFSDVIEILRKEEPLDKKHKLHKFNPFLDEDETLRVKTKLPLTNHIGSDRKFPIVIPKAHKVTDLIVLQYHVNHHHQLHKNVATMIMQKFFLPNIQTVVRQVIKNNCFQCKRTNAKPEAPMMGDLPSYRLALYEPPFSYVIIDVCGPFSIRMNRKTEKRWLLVTSCLTTRAIHIEILYSMTTQSFLMALQNTINLRGAPKRIICDQGSNFVGGSNLLKNCHEVWNKSLLNKGVILEPIEFEFSPAKASSMNGSVERMIGLIKNVLRKLKDTLDKKLIFPGDEVFRCVIVEIIGLLNNRPLCMTPFEGTENCFLTPNYFIMQRQNFQSAPGNEKFIGSHLKNWQEVKEFMIILWDQFNKSYIHELLFREKWYEPKQNYEIGDVVITADPTVYNLWRMGVVTKVVVGSQDQTRKLTIRLGKRNVIDKKLLTSKSSIIAAYSKENFIEITRPAQAVAPLNLSSNLKEK